MPIKRVNHFRAAPGQEEALRVFLQSVLAVIRTAPGCETVELLVNQGDASQLVILEQWTDVASHQAAANLIPPSELAAVAPLLAEPPKGAYYTSA